MNKSFLPIIVALGMTGLGATGIASAEALPGGSLDPNTVPKYVTPLVIPPVMNTNGAANTYDIAVREFKQQILPGGLWAKLPGCSDENCTFPATTVWSYGPDADPMPNASALGLAAGVAPAPNSQFNYPAYTIESFSNVAESVRWRNELVKDPVACKQSANPATDQACNYISHLLPIDQTLHWANPPAVGCRDGSNRTDCATNNPALYTGPVPIVTHVHGAHVDSHSDGYPEAWWLPAANNIPSGYVTHGTMFDDATGTNPGNLGYADFYYRNDLPATTAWYHDHSLGMTRSNVYAGPAGFWLVRGGQYDKVKDRVTGLVGVLPGPAPVAGQDVLSLNVPGNAVRNSIREIPIAIQDRSFNDDGSLFYPANRAFFEGLGDGQVPGIPGDIASGLEIDFVSQGNSDIAPTWNPEAFFNFMVVNGVTWPSLEVAPAQYRFRLLNGCNSRFLNLAMFVVNGDGSLGAEIPFYQIGAEQGFLRNVVRIETGFATPLPGNGTLPPLVPGSAPQQALLMGLAERADVLVDFSGLSNGTVVRMINTAPDEPFGGFDPETVPADPDTSGQVMQFVVNATSANAGGPLGASPTDPVLADGSTPNPNAATSPLNIVPKAESTNMRKVMVTRQVSLNEEESAVVCVEMNMVTGVITQVNGTPPNCPGDSMPFGPKEALLGTVNLADPAAPAGIALKWTDKTGASTPVNVTMADGVTVKQINVTENPTVGDTEIWEIYNFTADAHPIHLHLVRFEVLGRTLFDGTPSPHGNPQPWENGFKDTVISYPGEITTLKALFDVVGLYVWHCHIVEHEDNEMMRPYVVSPKVSKGRT
jgi:spore coat protein A